MKKKGILIFLVLLLSMSAFYFAKEMQKKLVSNEVAKGTESKVLQNNQKENSNNNSEKNGKEEAKNTEKADNNGEIKNGETKEASKTGEQNNSSKGTGTNEAGKQSTEKTATPKSSINTTSSTNSSTNTNTSQSSNSSNNQNQSSSLTPNFIVKDTVSDKVIVSKHIDFNGETVADITKQNTVYRVSSGDYFYEIAGLKAKDPNVGIYSGWCYYVNKSKLGIGAGDYVPKKDDLIEWKYLKDGVNN